MAKLLLCLVRVGVLQVSWAVMYFDKLPCRAVKTHIFFMKCFVRTGSPRL